MQSASFFPPLPRGRRLVASRGRICRNPCGLVSRFTEKNCTRRKLMGDAEGGNYFAGYVFWARSKNGATDWRLGWKVECTATRTRRMTAGGRRGRLEEMSFHQESRARRIAISTIRIPRNVCNSYIRLEPPGGKRRAGGERVTRPNAGVSIESRGWSGSCLLHTPPPHTYTHVNTPARREGKGKTTRVRSRHCGCARGGRGASR